MSSGVTAPGMRRDHLPRRRAINLFMEILAWIAAAIAVAILGIVVFSVAKKGASALNLDLLTKDPIQFSLTNAPQGLANAFAGTLVIVGLATLMALPVGILVAVYLNEFAPRSIRNAVTTVLDILNGIPAIVIGIFVLGLLVVGHGQSGTAGAFALACLMLPLVADEAVVVVPLVLPRAPLERRVRFRPADQALVDRKAPEHATRRRVAREHRAPGNPRAGEAVRGLQSAGPASHQYDVVVAGRERTLV